MIVMMERIPVNVSMKTCVLCCQKYVADIFVLLFTHLTLSLEWISCTAIGHNIVRVMVNIQMR